MAVQGRAAVGYQADARPHHTSRSAYLRQCGADDNQIDQDEPFDCHVNSTAWATLPGGWRDKFSHTVPRVCSMQHLACYNVCDFARSRVESGVM
ncbi:hypothetical protein [Halomonas cupida]|uniref:hypothetical protein n=1 Tax=Halomonas cupida TaxID=44933 RepID=UPI003A932854